MFFLAKNLERSIILTPDAIGMQFASTILQKLVKQMEGTCTPQLGFIIAILRIEETGEGIVDDEANIVFIVKYSALIFNPIPNEVLDGVVKIVAEIGLTVNVGPFPIFIPNQSIPREFKYVSSADPYYYDNKMKIGVDSVLRLKIVSFDIKIDYMYAIGTMLDDYLGPKI